MIFIAYLVGMGLPMLIGWILIRLCEGEHPVLYRIERWCMGAVLGMTLVMFMTFLLHIVGLTSFSFLGFLVPQLCVLGMLAILLRSKKLSGTSPKLPEPEKLPMYGYLVVGIMTIWILAKIFAGAYSLATVPVYFDDTFHNWNLRAKIFADTKELTLDIPRGKYDNISKTGVSSYPPSVPMIKTWLTSFHGKWVESTANVVHMVWYVLALAIVFFALVRVIPFWWAALGVYILTSIPLYLIHGSIAYADVYISLHIFIGVYALANSISAPIQEKKSWLFLGGLACALLAFTKNEGLVLYLPILIGWYVLHLLFLSFRKKIPAKQVGRTLFAIAVPCAVIVGPWMLFKLSQGLTFANAKSASNISISYNHDALKAIIANLFLRGSFGLLAPIFFLLLALKWRKILTQPFLHIFGAFFLCFIAQVGIFCFTSLSNEAIYQTGYARGVVQIVPLCVLLLTVLLREVYIGCIRQQQ